jgi:hypothetical protein
MSMSKPVLNKRTSYSKQAKDIGATEIAKMVSCKRAFIYKVLKQALVHVSQ